MPDIAETRPATSADFPFAWGLYRASVQALMEPHIVRERNKAWIDADEERRFSTIWDPSKVLIIVYNANPIGWLSVDSSRDEVHLENFYIVEQYRNKGLGTAVLNWLVEQYKGQSLITSVIVGSRSRSLYDRAGFAEVGTRDFETRLQLKGP
jgi:GNAT superfamily N-acetyltransferase